MNLPETTTHSFIIKIWLEETLQETGRVTWRGHIIPVPGDEKYYFEDLNEIPAFVMPYLEKMGVKFGSQGRVNYR